MNIRQLSGRLSDFDGFFKKLVGRPANQFPTSKDIDDAVSERVHKRLEYEMPFHEIVEPQGNVFAFEDHPNVDDKIDDELERMRGELEIFKKKNRHAVKGIV